MCVLVLFGVVAASSVNVAGVVDVVGVSVTVREVGWNGCSFVVMPLLVVVVLRC